MTITVMAMFRNESWNLNEWINHYKNEGVEEIILIDNESIDDWREKLKSEYLEDEHITFKECPGSAEHRQMRIYNEILKQDVFKTDWLLVCDLDEFIYARKGLKTLNEYFDRLPDIVSQVKIPWKIFGSSGHETQPESIIESFVHWKPVHSKHMAKFGGTQTAVKAAIKVDSIRSLGVHVHYPTKGVTITVDGRQSEVHPHVKPYDMSNDYIHCNHYYTQSLEYFEKIQIDRRGGNNPRNVKDRAWFDANKDGKYTDHELAEKTY